MMVNDIPFYIQKEQSTARVLFHASFPVERHSSKKNQKNIKRNVHTGKMFIGNTDKNNAALNYLVSMFVSARLNQDLHEPINKPIWLLARFHYPKVKDTKTKQWRRTEAVADLSNLLQGPEDALIKAGVIKDDKLIESYDGSRRVTGERHALELYVIDYGDIN